MENITFHPTRRGFAASLERIQLRPWMQIGRSQWPAWRFFVLLGFVLGILLIAFLGWLRGYSFWTAGGVGLAAGLACAAYALFRKALFGYENYTFYHYQFVVLVMGIGLAWLLRLPPLPYLDFLSMGIAAALAIGRFGCLRAGCCYGRPHHWGVCYREEHGKLGFPSHLLNVRLLPVQMIEAVWLGIVILAGIGLLLSGQQAGSTLVWYLLAYSVGRYILEFLRGDPPRPYWLGASEAQWTSITVVAVLILLEATGFLPGQPWHVLVLIVLLAGIFASYWLSRPENPPSQRQILHARHIRELARAIDKVAAIDSSKSPRAGSPSHGRAFVVNTSLGIRISGDVIREESGRTYHYAISSQQGFKDQKPVRVLASLILQLRHPSSSGELISGNHGVYHLLVRN